jgi:hypothetical protein
MGRSRAWLAAIVCLACGVLTPTARGATAFHPRVGGALGLVPSVNRHGQLRAADVASGLLTPVTYHGGPVMSGGVTVHTIFWAPAGFAFQGSPGPGIPTYKGLIQQFFSDVAAAGGAWGGCASNDCNVFTIERQYAQGTRVGQITPGSYSIGYSSGSDSIDATDPYPSKADQCASPAGASVCLTDGEVTNEVDHIVQATGGARGLNNLWFVFLPPGVDECIDPGSCATNTFAGYHAVSNVAGHGATIYAVAIDPIIEAPIPPGADPQGYPDAEVALDIAAHEVNEAITDPEGNGWMDPNGFEVGDKCDTGPQTGGPLGFASDGSPYNQVINGHQYLLQEEWANADAAGNDNCVQASPTTNSQLPLPQVNLRQFNPVITGNVNRFPGGGIGVRVTLLRTQGGIGPVAVARASTTTAADGSWIVSLAPHAVGDDRDEIVIDYSGPGAPSPSHQVILTGNGGNPFTEAGWMGWLDMDTGSAVHSAPGATTLALAPCFQAGTLSFAVNGASSIASPNDACNTQTDVATQSIASVRPGDSLTWTSNDNRAFDAPGTPSPNLFGGLVSLTARAGEPGSVSAIQSPLTTFTAGGLPSFTAGGLPSCTADLELLAVVCTGLVPGDSYTLIDGRQRQGAIADSTGSAVALLSIRRGDAVALSNGSRILTTLHVAHLKVQILGDESFISGGSCQAGDYFGAPLSKVSVNTAAGTPTDTAAATNGGVTLTGQICPRNGHAAGLPTAVMLQTDDLSGGQTETEVPDIQDTSPVVGETVYGRFTALAESGLALPGNQLLPTDVATRISLKVSTFAGANVLTVGNVDTGRGVFVPALTPGSYLATWTLIDLNGDTRVQQTRFIEERGALGSGPQARVTCRLTGGSTIRCAVRFPAFQGIRGSVRIRLSRAGALVAAGQGRLRGARATIRMPTLASVGAGRWQAALVLSGPHIEPVTIRSPATRVT